MYRFSYTKTRTTYRKFIALISIKLPIHFRELILFLVIKIAVK